MATLIDSPEALAEAAGAFARHAKLRGRHRIELVFTVITNV